MECQNFKNSIDTNDFIECEYCKNKLFRKQIKINLNSRESIFNLNYERCTRKNAIKYWEEFDKAKKELQEQEEKLNYIKEFNRKVDKLFSQSKIGYQMRNKNFDNFICTSNNSQIIKDIKENNWYDSITWTAKQCKEYEGLVINAYKNIYQYKNEQAKSLAQWFIINYGLKVKNNNFNLLD